jgi:hypothetical protein
MAANPNEYDEDRCLVAEQRLNEAIHEMWEAGAEEEDIRREFDEGLASAKSGD